MEKATKETVMTYRFKDFEHAFTDDSIFRCFDTTKGMNFTKILGVGIGLRLGSSKDQDWI